MVGRVQLSKRHHLKRTLVETCHGDRILSKVQKYKIKMSFEKV